MEDNTPQEDVKAPEVTETSDQVAGASENKGDAETVEELKARLENLKAENARKAQKIEELREMANKPAATVYNPNDLTTWNDRELKAVKNDPQYAHLADQAEEILQTRSFNRFLAKQQEQQLKQNAELQRQKLYPESFNPSSQLSLAMQEILVQYRLDNTPAGRLAAAEIASSRMKAQAAEALRRKQEQDRVADVTGNFSGGNRPQPPKVDTVKLEELKKRAMAGDEQARRDWFKARGII